MKTIFLRLALLVSLLGFAAAPAARAENLGTVKARMAQRLATLDQLKARGEIGENNRGLIEVRGSSGGDVVAAENKDRDAVYAAIAQQTGSSAEAVGRARARQIAAGSAAGVWIQKDDGAWYRIPATGEDEPTSQIQVGMTKGQVRELAGAPSSESETKLKNATIEYWHYSLRSGTLMVRFDDAKVTSVTRNR